MTWQPAVSQHIAGLESSIGRPLFHRLPSGVEPTLADALSEEPLLAYSLDRPLVDAWLELNVLDIKLPLPALMGQDLRALQRPLKLGIGWTVLPQYLCAAALADGSLMEINGPVGRGKLDYYLAWTASGLRQPRVAHARQALLWRLTRADDMADQRTS